MKRLIALLFLPLAAYAGYEVTRPLMTVTDCAGNAIEGVSRSTDETYAIQKAVALGPGEWCIERPDIRVVVDGEQPEPEPEPEPEPTPPPVVIPPAKLQGAIVYSRVPRTLSTEFKVGEEVRVLRHADVQDKLAEVGHFKYGFTAPGQLALLTQDLEQRVLHDCMVTEKPCVPMDGVVSLDGRRVAYSVYYADTLYNGKLRANETLPNQYLSSKNGGARIVIQDLETGERVEWPYQPGIYDTNPIWLPTGQIMFSSNRSGGRQPYIPRATPSSAAPPHLFIADEDGSGAVDISPHELAGALHPWLLNNGRVAYSSKWFSHNLPFISTNGGVNWFTTLENMWVLVDIDHRGGDMTALLGSHRNGFKGGGQFRNMKALHYIGQLDNGDVCIANYYRRNNLGLGEIWCFSPEPKLLEGPAPKFLPRNLYVATEWGKSNDEPCWELEGCAKAGWPEGTPDGQLMMAVGRGWCTTVAYSPTKTPEKIDARGIQGCDVGIYKTTVIPSKSVTDMQVVVDDPEWHEFNARVVRARNIPIPELDNTDDGSCVLASSDAGSTDAHHYGAYKFNDMYRAMANNGGEIHGLDHSELAAIRFYEVVPNGSKRPSNITGNDLLHMGDVPLLSDKSFSASLPCEKPFLMAGVDSDGRIIKRDQIPMALRPGEKRICTGCHLHGSEGRPYEESLAYSADPVPLLTSEPVVSWSDVLPIVERRCDSCHAGGPFNNYDHLTYDIKQEHAINRTRMGEFSQSWKNYALHRPATSRYINSMFARESMFYWVFMGSRQDGRTNDQYPDDLDYPIDHPDVGATEAEQRLVAHWIDGGYPR